jgi:hypothetical protein
MSTQAPVPSPEPPPTVGKVAVSETTRRRLRHEAAVLRRAAHPGVVRLASFLDLTDRSELRTVRAGDATLLTTTPPDAATALAFAAGLAATLADLHQLGVVHGRLTPDHVVVAPGGRAVLCGFGEAREGDPEVDIRSFASLLELLATGVPSRGTGRRDRRCVERLLAVAHDARVAGPAPSAASLAQRLGAAAPASASATATASRRDAPRRPTRLGVRAVAAGVVAVAALVAAVGATTGLSGELPRVADDVGAPATTAPRSPSPASTRPTTTPTASPRPSSAERFTAAGALFQVGQTGDVVVTGDWDCDGTLGAALLRPANGDVFAFDVLATPSSPVSGRFVTTVPDGRTLETIDQPDGCTTLLARRADGSPQTLTVVTP